MPPHSVFEWVVGQNLPRKKAKPSGREVVKIEVTTDDEADTESITVTYPRNSKSSRRRNKHRKPSSVPSTSEEKKKVTFEKKPLKSALKKRQDASSSEASSGASSEASSEASSNESSAEQSSEEEPLSRSKKARDAKKTEPSSREARSGNGSSQHDKHKHQNCVCSCCATGLLLLAKMDEITKNGKRNEVTENVGEKAGQKKNGSGSGNGKEIKGGDKGNGKAAQGKKAAKNKSDTEAESGASTGHATSVEDTATESEPEPPKTKKKTKQQTIAVSSETEAATETDPESEPPKKGKQSGKKKENEKKEKQHGDEAAGTKNGNQAKEGGKASGSKEAAGKKTRDGPADENIAGDRDNGSKKGGTVYEKKADAAHPHLIMPVRERSIQMEHVVEDPARDAPPNAYFDNDKNVCRVYHGPYWGYPYGQPYLRGGLNPQFPAPAWLPVPDTQAVPGHRDNGPQIPSGFPPPPQQPAHTVPYPTWGQPYGQFPPAPPYGSTQQRPVGVSGIPGSPLTAEALKRHGFDLNPLFGNLKPGHGEKHESRGSKSRERHKTLHDEYKSAKGSGVQWNTPPTTWVKLPSNKSKNGSHSGRQNNDGSNEKKKRKDEGGSNDGNNKNGNSGDWGNKNNNNPTNDDPNDWTNNNSNNNDNDWCNNGNNDWGNKNNDNNSWGNNNDIDNDNNDWSNNNNNTPKPSPEPFRPDPVSSMPGSWSPPGGKANIEWKGGDDGDNNNAASWMDPTAAQAAATW
ncbi:hypothetical protein VTG60DRAFT_5803 [Thermothelomyces hinnuleus]